MQNFMAAVTAFATMLAASPAPTVKGVPLARAVSPGPWGRMKVKTYAPPKRAPEPRRVAYVPKDERGGRVPRNQAPGPKLEAPPAALGFPRVLKLDACPCGCGASLLFVATSPFGRQRVDLDTGKVRRCPPAAAAAAEEA